MDRHKYKSPSGATVDKRTWPIGTLVTATLQGGGEVKTTTASWPSKMPSGTWCVRVAGVDGLLWLTRVKPRFQLELFHEGQGGAVGSEKMTSTHGDGTPCG